MSLETKIIKLKRIDVVDDNVVYINLNGWTYYIDDSTKEQILEKYKEKE